MELKLAGYFPKRVEPRPAWLDVPEVTEVCSVSHCISPGPEGWVDRWLHNDLAFFDSPDLALRVSPGGGKGFRIFAYRIGSTRYRNGLAEAWEWPLRKAVLLAPGFGSLGFDVVSKSLDSGLGFECSPLSCNRMAKEIGVNDHCLLDVLTEAVAVAQEFSTHEPEPGPYYVVEVLEGLPSPAGFPGQVKAADG